MPIPNQPKHDWFSYKRVQLLGREIIKHCGEDRERALEVFEYFKTVVKNNPEDDRAKVEMLKSLQLSMDANDRKLKLVETMLKLQMQREKLHADPKAVKKSIKDMSFDDFQLADD